MRSQAVSGEKTGELAGKQRERLVASARRQNPQKNLREMHFPVGEPPKNPESTPFVLALDWGASQFWAKSRDAS